jgi:hypothetical protein
MTAVPRPLLIPGYDFGSGALAVGEGAYNNASYRCSTKSHGGALRMRAAGMSSAIKPHLRCVSADRACASPINRDDC